MTWEFRQHGTKQIADFACRLSEVITVPAIVLTGRDNLTGEV